MEFFPAEFSREESDEVADGIDPNLHVWHPLRKQVLYRLGRKEWERRRSVEATEGSFS
jgi:hypothetical protein